MICLSETYLDSSYAYDDTRLNLKNFTLIRADNPHNCKRGGVSIYFKEQLAVRPVSPSNLMNIRMSLISFFWILNSLYLRE